MWKISGTSEPIGRFQPFVPARVLYEFEGPRIFNLRDRDGRLHLVYWSDEDDEVYRYVVVPTTGTILAAVAEGRLSVLDALNQPRCWACDVNHHGELTQCQRVDFAAIPRDSLPAIGTMLLPNLRAGSMRP